MTMKKIIFTPLLFEAPPVYQEDIVLWTRTNNAGNETKLYVKDVDGNDIFSKS